MTLGQDDTNTCIPEVSYALNPSVHALKGPWAQESINPNSIGGGGGLFGPCDANFSKSARVRTIITLI